MARGRARNRGIAVREAERALDRFKYEVAREVGLGAQVSDGYWGEIPSRDCGAVGGHMVRRMIEAAERQLTNQYGTNQTAYGSYEYAQQAGLPASGQQQAGGGAQGIQVQTTGPSPDQPKPTSGQHGTGAGQQQGGQQQG